MALNLIAKTLCLLVCAKIANGDSSFSLINGSTGYCRQPGECIRNYVYHGSDCSCVTPAVCCIDSGITRSKCNEYSQYVYAEEEGAALSARRVLARVSVCHNEAVSLIVGGVKAHPKEFPHMVAIGYGPRESKSWMCGGSLISEKHVLSAAHCHYSEDLGPAAWARLGALMFNGSEDDTAQDYGIMERIIHPGFAPPSRYHDIAIFVLEQEVIMTSSVRPACLNFDPDIFYKKLTATGWGKLEFDDTVGSSHLMKVLLDVIQPEVCNMTYRTDIGGPAMKYGVTKTQICAGYLEGGKDSCQGDSGGPLQASLATPYCMYSIVGIVSFGKFCGFANTSAVYTRVSQYIPWIESVVWT